MSPAELLDAGDHLAACPECRRQVTAAATVEARLAALRDDFKQQSSEPPKHLNYEHLAAYVDDRLDEVDREIVESHTSICAPCKEELRDLFAFKETLTENAPSTLKEVESTTTLREKAKAWWNRPAWAARWGIVAGMVALVLIALVVWLPFRNTKESPVVKLEQTPSPTPTQASSPQVSPSATPNGSTTPTPEVKPTAQPNLPPIDNPALVLALNDNGEQITVDGQGKLVGLESLPASERQAVRSALLAGRLEAPAALKDVRGKNGTLMGGGGAENSFSVLSPAGTILMTGRPTFRWRALAGATSYSVKIYDTNFNAVASSDGLTATQWTLSSSSRPLAPGQVYTWQVVAVKDGQEIISPAPPAPEARFKVLSAQAAEELNRSLASGRNSHLARGVIYTRAGLLDEAEREFEALARENPQSGTARKLLNDVRALRRAK